MPNRKKTVYSSVFRTPIGHVTALWGEDCKLTELKFGEHERELPKPLPQFSIIVARKLDFFFQGKVLNLDEIIDWSQFSSFQRAVYQTTLSIPFGETLTYLDVAKKVGGVQHARAVGQCLKHNPYPLFISCHRVIESTGKLGGFAGGRSLKRDLLNFEGEQKVLRSFAQVEGENSKNSQTICLE